MTQTTPTPEQIAEGLRLADEYVAASATTDWSMTGEAARMARTLQAVAAQLAEAQAILTHTAGALVQAETDRDKAESAAASARETLSEIADMIVNCAGVPTQPDSLPQMILQKIRALKQQSAPVTPSATKPRSMKMSDVKVGDRLVSTIAGGPAFSPITVTEITERGFRYKLDAPVCLHPLMGATEGGEHFGHDGECYYEPIPSATKEVMPDTRSEEPGPRLHTATPPVSTVAPGADAATARRICRKN